MLLQTRGNTQMRNPLAPVFLAALACFGFAKCADAKEPGIVASVNGHGVWALDTGDVYDNHQPYIESTVVDAWLNADGSAGGTIVWMDTYNGPADGHGESYSGYTWQIDVDRFEIVSENEVYVEGTIFHSNVESDIGYRAGFAIYDGGSKGTDGVWYNSIPEFGYYVPVLKGNFRID